MDVYYACMNMHDKFLVNISGSFGNTTLLKPTLWFNCGPVFLVDTEWDETSSKQLQRVPTFKTLLTFDISNSSTYVFKIYFNIKGDNTYIFTYIHIYSIVVIVCIQYVQGGTLALCKSTNPTYVLTNDSLLIFLFLLKAPDYGILPILTLPVFFTLKFLGINCSVLLK